ncbi:serpin family protein [Cryptosporangium aurantiacum]|nr:serpin family protein [Cryptosporangium aurantiacum]
MPQQLDRFPQLVARYAERLHLALSPGHQVASPLGAWLVLALAAPAATGSVRATLEDVLGEPAQAAAARAGRLLAEPHPAVAAAAALWTRADQRTPALQAWESGLADVVERGAVPSQEGANAWAADRTGGLIDEFPIQVDARTLLVLASALATDVSWGTPFDTVPAAELGADSPWAGRVTTALRAPSIHRCFLALTRDAGTVAVHAADSADDDPLVVVSVIAAPDVAPPAVLAAAHRIASDHVAGLAPRLSLFDLPLGEGHAWTITEEPTQTHARDGREERFAATLPAWSARSTHDLLRDPRTGFAEAAAALVPLLPPQPEGFAVEAVQSAMAAYSRVGFKAAAVTALGIRLAGMPPAPRPGLLRRAALRFGRPYAVVAVAQQRRRGPWHGVPVFSAWVAEPSEA